MPLVLQPDGHLAAAEERAVGVLLVDQLHQVEVLRCLRCRLVIQAGATQPQQLALPTNAQLRVVDLHQRPLQLRGLGHFFLSHSNSILSRPICSNSSAWMASALTVAGLTPWLKRSSTPLSSCFFQPWMRVGWTEC